jgi:hypothetical protein
MDFTNGEKAWGSQRNVENRRGNIYIYVNISLDREIGR